MIKGFALGRPMSGKTELSKRVLAAVLLEGIPSIVHDPRSEFPARGINGGPGMLFMRPRELPRWSAQAPLTIVRAGDEESAEAVAAAAVAYTEKTRRPSFVLFNEFILAVEGRHWFAPSAKNILYNGRHLGAGAGVGMWGNAIAPQLVSPRVFEAADEVDFFNMQGPAVERYLRDWMGEDFAEAVATLPFPPNPQTGAAYIRWTPNGDFSLERAAASSRGRTAGSEPANGGSTPPAASIEREQAIVERPLKPRLPEQPAVS